MACYTIQHSAVVRGKNIRSERTVWLKLLNCSKPSLILSPFPSTFYQETCEKIRAIERLEKVEGLEAWWQNFFHQTPEQAR